MLNPVEGNYPVTLNYQQHLASADEIIRTHAGIDWAPPIGTRLNAIENGHVRLTTDPKDGNILLYLTSLDGRRVWEYMHLQKYGYVVSGQEVAEGNPIAYVGKSGYVFVNNTGCFHLSLFDNGVRKDPALYIPLGSNIITIGSFVKFSAAEDIKAGNGLNYPTQVKADTNTIWKIIEGPRSGDGHFWYNVQQYDEYGNAGGTGWAMADKMSVFTYVPKPKPTPTPAQTCEQKLAAANKAALDYKAKYETVIGQLVAIQSKLKQINDLSK